MCPAPRHYLADFDIDTEFGPHEAGDSAYLGAMWIALAAGAPPASRSTSAPLRHPTDCRCEAEKKPTTAHQSEKGATLGPIAATTGPSVIPRAPLPSATAPHDHR